jgi:arabinose-5-phosphate isomerase
MATASDSAPAVHPDLVCGREVVAREAAAVAAVGARLGDAFVAAVEAVAACEGRVVVTGMGKAGFIAQRLSALLASVGTPSLYLHPADAVHGDLGRVTPSDVVIAVSNSGATEELVRLVPSLQQLGVALIALTGNPDSPLARAARFVLDIGPMDEACDLNLVPTASSAALHALGDALAMAVSRRHPLTEESYARVHPGGALGRKVARVREVMRQGEANPVVKASSSLRDALLVMSNTRGRPGCALVEDGTGKLVGIFTDGDLRRLLEHGAVRMEAPIGEVMHAGPARVGPDDLVTAAAAVLRARHIDQLPVVDADGRTVGLLDVQDLLDARFL